MAKFKNLPQFNINNSNSTKSSTDPQINYALFHTATAIYCFLAMLMALISWSSLVANDPYTGAYNSSGIKQDFLTGISPNLSWLVVLILTITIVVLKYTNLANNAWLNFTDIALGMLIFSYSTGYYQWLNFSHALWPALFADSAIVIIALNWYLQKKAGFDQTLLYIVLGINTILMLWLKFFIRLTWIGFSLDLILTSLIIYRYYQCYQLTDQQKYASFDSHNLANMLIHFYLLTEK